MNYEILANFIATKLSLVMSERNSTVDMDFIIS